MLKYLHSMKDGEWRVRVPVSPALVPIWRKKERTRRIKAANEEEADKIAAPWITRFQAEIADAECQLSGYVGPHHTFYGDPGFSFGSGVRIRKGKPSPDMIPVFGEDGRIYGYRFRKPSEPATGVGFDELVALFVYRGTRPQAVKARRAVAGKMKRLAEFLGHGDASRVTADDLTDYPAELLRSGLDPNTVDDHLVYVRALFALAKEAGRIPTNPAEHLQRP